MLAIEQRAERPEVGQPGRAARRPVDDHPVGLEQDRERVRRDDRLEGRVLLEDVQLIERREAVQPGRQEPPQAHEVRLDVAKVAEEDVAGRDQVGAGQGEHELDDGDHRDEQEVRRDPVRVEEHQGHAAPRVPNAKLTTPATTAAVGRTILGNWICLISVSLLTIDEVASLIDEVNHFQGRIAAKMKSG